jgi:23S rRNA pseudouridine2605 synthase
MFAGLTKKNVDRGKWRYLSEKEVRALKFFGADSKKSPKKKR